MQHFNFHPQEKHEVGKPAFTQLKINHKYYMKGNCTELYPNKYRNTEITGTHKFYIP